MEELSTLATGFEVDGSQLRFQLYIWLEKSVDCLRTLCGYQSDGEDTQSDSGQPIMIIGANSGSNI